MIGEGALAIATVAAAGKFNDWVELNFKSRSCGHIQLEVTYTGDAAASPPGAAAPPGVPAAVPQAPP